MKVFIVLIVCICIAGWFLGENQEKEKGPGPITQERGVELVTNLHNSMCADLAETQDVLLQIREVYPWVKP